MNEEFPHSLFGIHIEFGRLGADIVDFLKHNEPPQRSEEPTKKQKQRASDPDRGRKKEKEKGDKKHKDKEEKSKGKAKRDRSGDREREFSVSEGQYQFVKPKKYSDRELRAAITPEDFLRTEVPVNHTPKVSFSTPVPLFKIYDFLMTIRA